MHPLLAVTAVCVHCLTGDVQMVTPYFIVHSDSCSFTASTPRNCLLRPTAWRRTGTVTGRRAHIIRYCDRSWLESVPRKLRSVCQGRGNLPPVRCPASRVR